MGFDPSPAAPIPVVIELNLRHRDGLEGAAEQFLAHFRATLPDAPDPERVADTYFRCVLTEDDILRLVEADQRQEDAARRAIYRVWPDFPVHPLIDASCATVKADAARRSFDATGRGITWAVLDSGIDGDHHHFRRYDTLKGDVANLHRDFTKPGEPTLGDALVDQFGHGTHVAGIIAGGLPPRMPRGSNLRVVERVFDPARPETPTGPGPPGQPARGAGRDRPRSQAGQPQGARRVGQRPVHERAPGAGVRPQGHQRLRQAAARPRGQPQPRLRVRPRVVRLRPEPACAPRSTAWSARGWWWSWPPATPATAAVDRRWPRQTNVGLDHDHQRPRQRRPGHHRRLHPPRHARTPTGCRTSPPRARPATAALKPDLVAPGERITSCAAGSGAGQRVAGGQRRPRRRRYYVEDSGTSMAAPHVSGAVAAFLSDPPRIHRPARARSSGSSWSRPPPWAASATSRATAWST